MKLSIRVGHYFDCYGNEFTERRFPIAVVVQAKPRARNMRGKLAILMNMPLDVLVEVSNEH